MKQKPTHPGEMFGTLFLKRCYDFFVTMKWIAIFLLVGPGIVLAESDLVFHLCSTNVQQAVVGEETNDGWPVFVKLTEEGATHFESFTETNIGSISRIVANGQTFLNVTIQAPISGGVLQQTFSSEDVALTWQQTLTEGLPAAPCGAD